MSAGQESGSPIRENEPCSRRRYRQTKPEGRSPPLRGCLRSGYALRRVGAKDYSSAPLTEPDVRASHSALWIDISEVQRELNRNLRRVKVVPQDFERGHPSGEPCRRIGSRHCPNVGLHPCSLAAVRAGGG